MQHLVQVTCRPAHLYHPHDCCGRHHDAGLLLARRTANNAVARRRTARGAKLADSVRQKVGHERGTVHRVVAEQRRQHACAHEAGGGVLSNRHTDWSAVHTVDMAVCRYAWQQAG